MVVHTVLYYDSRRAGSAGDCTHIAHFRSLAAAQRFARDKICYGAPATVETDEVPVHIAQRWH